MSSPGYKIEGIAPPDLASYPPAVRKQYWQWVVDLGLKRKDKELSEGLDKDGKPLRAIKARTKKYRRSAMTPSGKGDPEAPPLIPGWQKSRTRSLLAGKATSSYAEFWWRYDAWTGASWGEVLEYQAKKGRDVFGLSPEGTALVEARALAKWEAWKSRSVSEPAPTRSPSAEAPRKRETQPTANQGGRQPTPAATYGIGTNKPRVGHGGRTQEEWNKYFRASASARPPGREASPKAKSPVSGPLYNRLIKYTWPQSPGAGPTPGSAAPVRTGPGPRKTTPKPSFGFTLANLLGSFFRTQKPVAKPKPKPKPPRKIEDLVTIPGTQGKPGELIPPRATPKKPT
jgi:hypothetical protein